MVPPLTIVSCSLREIGNTDPKDLERDSSGTRAYASFLTELAERIPAVALNHMMVLLPLLDEDVCTSATYHL